jgi:hypothetical protein|tara:strand:- start:1581 stop:1790 length:210 start_codon:yes stop_codon:yes gene_type:complete
LNPIDYYIIGSLTVKTKNSANNNDIKPMAAPQAAVAPCLGSEKAGQQNKISVGWLFMLASSRLRCSILP